MLNVKAGLQQVPFLKRLFKYGRDDKPAMSVTLGADDFGDEGTNVWSLYKQAMNLGSDRLAMYEELERMSEDDLLASCLDLFAEEVTQPDLVSNRVVWVESEDKKIKELLDRFLLDMKLDDEAFPLCREIALYGDSFNAVIQARREDGTPGEILGLLPIDPKTIHRKEDKLGRLRGFYRGKRGTQDNSEKSGMLSNPWDYMHFRLRGRDRHGMYGTSMLAACRRVFRMLRLMEDAVSVYRLKMSPSRFMFGVKGMSGLSVEQRTRIINKLRQSISKTMVANKNTNEINQEVNPMSLDENIFYDAESVDVSHVPGVTHVDRVLDLDYFKKRLFMCLRIPPDYLGQSEAAGGLLAQTPLAQQDVAFARYVKRLQRAFMEGVIRLCQVQLAWSGLNPVLHQFTIHMQPVSYLDEMQLGNLTRIRAETILLLEQIGQALDLDRKAWLKHVFKLSGFPSELLSQVSGEGTGVGVQGNVELTSDEEAMLTKAIVDSPKLLSMVKQLTENSVSSKAVPFREEFVKNEDGSGKPMRSRIEQMLSDTTQENKDEQAIGTSETDVD